MIEITKGEWTFIEDDDTFQIYVPGKSTVAKIHKRWGDDSKANAQLIVSAPDLYEACRAALDYPNLPEGTRNKLFEATHKAEGK